MSFSFGTPSTGSSSLFAPGASTATAATPSFGFGATSTGTSTPGAPFGTSQPTTGFGFGTTPAPTTTTGFGFGATPTSTLGPTSTPSPFGTTSATTTPSLFGTTPATTTTMGFGTSGTSFGFGTSTTAPTATTPSIFGNTSSTMFPTSASLTPLQPTVPTGKAILTPQQAIQNVSNAYNPNHPECRFRHMMYNLVGADAVNYTRPGNVPEKLWAQAVEANPDPSRLVPVQATGFADLKKRVEDQDKTTQEHFKSLEDLQNFIGSLQRKHELDISLKIEQYKRRHLELCHKVLIVMKKVETLRNRGYSISSTEEQYRNKVENLLRELSQPNLYKARLNDLIAMVRMQEERDPGYYESLDENSLDAVHNFLTQQTTALSHLVNIIKRDSRDVNIMLDSLVDIQAV